MFSKCNELLNKKCLFQANYPVSVYGKSTNQIEDLEQYKIQIEKLIQIYEPNVSINFNQDQLGKISTELATRGVKYFADKLNRNIVPNNVGMIYSQSNEFADLEPDKNTANVLIGYSNGFVRNAEASGLSKNEIFKTN